MGTGEFYGCTIRLFNDEERNTSHSMALPRVLALLQYHCSVLARTKSRQNVGGQTGKSQRPNGHPMDTTAAEYLRHIFLLRIQPPTEPKTAPQNPNCRYRAFGCTASYGA